MKTTILLGLFFFCFSTFANTSLPRRTPIPQNPFMAPNGLSNMHSDSYMSDTHDVAGPESGNVQFFEYGGLAGECAAFAFDRNGHIVTVCAKLDRSDLLVLDANSLQVLASYRLPARDSTWQNIGRGNLRGILKDTSGGSYFYLDHLDRAVIASADRIVRIIAIQNTGANVGLKLDEEFDLNPLVPSNCWTGLNCDRVTTALPDWEGHIWFVTRQGRIGTIDLVTKKVVQTQIRGEEIQNSFAMAEDGVYIATDYALYRMKADANGIPQVLWREVYDRGVRVKPGQINQGTGTTPTLIGSDFIAITDNADPKMNLLVYRRNGASAELICKHPVFKDQKSATENSVIAYENSILIENNYGYVDPFSKSPLAGGVVRVDFNEKEKTCQTIWESSVVSPTAVPKLALGNATVYLYSPGREKWALTGVDFHTGETKFKIETGSGYGYNNNWASITLTPTGDALIGTLKGFLRIH